LHLFSHAPSTPRILSSALHISYRSVVVGHDVGREPPPTLVLFFSFSFLLIHYTPYMILTRHVDARSHVPHPRCQAGSRVRSHRLRTPAQVPADKSRVRAPYLARMDLADVGFAILSWTSYVFRHSSPSP
jgi:hypothetical protein